jgi:hypothetical protein
MGFRERSGLYQRLSLPVRDFEEFVTLASYWPTSQSTGGSIQFVDLLEKSILQGSLEFQEESGGAAHPPSRRLRYVGAGGVSLDVQAAASMVKSLAGLDLYLSTFAVRDSLLIIDEPEMNAHPEAQLKIIELLAILAARGIYVVITTHSPYITDHLINLMQASRLSETMQESVRERFKLGSTEAFLDPEKVSVYYFSEEGKVERVLDRGDALIDLSSFSNPSDYTSNLYSVLLEAERGIDLPKWD